MKDDQLEQVMTNLELAAWISFRKEITTFLGNLKDSNNNDNSLGIFNGST